MKTIRPGFVNPCIVKVYKGIVINNNSYKHYKELDDVQLKKLIGAQKINLEEKKKYLY